ncbi:helix-turn-helix domain-containing protein [Amycolatopsis sp. NPDC059657]|uniref:helix-turn-helix domain-containing protein n=1 Tax=Amycolatopsis sp. NPDC059657 TaxID=3346899 RepID=UPI003670DDB2
MSENWSAVAKAIDERVNELGLRQRELAERSHVSQAIVRELQHHTVERKRSGRTLEALSLALEWHPGHLSAILNGQVPLKPGETGDPVLDEIATRLGAIEDRLRDITDRLDAMGAHRVSDAAPAGREDRR